MRKIILFIAVCTTAWSAAAQDVQKNDTEGIRKSDKPEIRQISKTGNSFLLSLNNPKDYADSADFICPILKIRKEEATMVYESEKTTIKHERKDDKNFVMFTAPVEFTFKLSKNKLLLRQQYDKYDWVTRKGTTCLIHIKS